ncbi:succinate dehydrogenase, partial [Bacillus spizizenii]|nr:succinate dehydrogenase [Bacillus spizizenii]
MSGNRELYFRRLQSLLCVIPVGIFLIQHIVVNQFAARGAEAVNSAAQFMDSLPVRNAMEIFIIFIPLIKHAVYGV